MEEMWFATKSDSYAFNLESVKIRKKVIAPYKVEGNPKIGKKLNLEISEIPARQTFGTIFQSLFGQCLKILLIPLKNLKNLQQN